LPRRTTAAPLLFTRELFPALLDLLAAWPDQVRRLLDYLAASDYFFLRLSMASSKAAADAARGIEGSSVVTAMVFSCRDFAIRVSGPRRPVVPWPAPDEVRREAVRGVHRRRRRVHGRREHDERNGRARRVRTGRGFCPAGLPGWVRRAHGRGEPCHVRDRARRASGVSDPVSGLPRR